MEIYLVVIIAMVAAGIGVALMYVVSLSMQKNKASNIVKEAEAKAEVMKKDRMLEAKEKFMQLKSEHEKEVMQRNQQLITNENKLKQKEQSLNQKLESTQRKDQELEQIRASLEKQQQSLSLKKEEVEKAHQTQVKQLEKIAGLTAAEAKAQLVDTLTEEARTDAMSMVKDLVDEAKLTANKEAKKIILSSIQRSAAEHAIENS